MNITHETNQLDDKRAESLMKLMRQPPYVLWLLGATLYQINMAYLMDQRKFYFSSDLNLFQRLWDWILH